MPTIAVIADNLLWGYGPPGAPGEILPGAKEIMEEVRRRGRVVLVSHHLNTLAGHRNVVTTLVGADIPYDDLWLAPGFPEHDEVVANVAHPERECGAAE